MASRVRVNLPKPDEAVEPERPPPALSSDLLEEILLRVASPTDLARASAACVSFRRLIADHSFLRRYRSIHPPLLLGFVSLSGFHPVEAPHPSAAVGRAVARAADFSFDYLPRPTTEWDRWRPCDVRNGRVLVGCRSEKGASYWNLAVCDPLSRRYLLLPPITDDLLASVELQRQNMFHPRVSFIPSRGGPSGGIEEETSFSVILWMQSNTNLGVLVFSSVSGCWSVSMSTNRYVLGLNKIGELISGQCAYDCFYWKVYNMSTLIKLDMNTMQFCTSDLPPGHDVRRIVIVESGRNKVAMFSLNFEGPSVDYYTFSQNGSEESHEWHMMSTIPLPADYNISHCFHRPTEGCIFLQGIPIEQDPIERDEKHAEFFSLEIKSFKIERASITSFAFCGHLYFGFPPSMSPIRIQGYGEEWFPSRFGALEAWSGCSLLYLTICLLICMWLPWVFFCLMTGVLKCCCIELHVLCKKHQIIHMWSHISAFIVLQLQLLAFGYFVLYLMTTQKKSWRYCRAGRARHSATGGVWGQKCVQHKY